MAAFESERRRGLGNGLLTRAADVVFVPLGALALRFTREGFNLICFLVVSSLLAQVQTIDQRRNPCTLPTRCTSRSRNATAFLRSHPAQHLTPVSLRPTLLIPRQAHKPDAEKSVCKTPAATCMELCISAPRSLP